MRRSLLAFPLLACACAGGQRPPGGEPPGPEIHDVRIEGAISLDAGSILERLATRGPSGLPLLRSHPHLDPAALPLDVRRIRDIHEEEGHYAAQVSSEVVPLSDGTVDVIFHVREGPPTTVRSLVVAGLEALDPVQRARVLEDAPLLRGDRLVEERYEELKAQLQRRLEQEGFARAEVQGRVEIDPAGAAADVLFAARPGTRYRFGAIEVRGDQLVPAAKIRQAVETVLDPGDAYDPRLLEEAQAEVTALGPFALATVSTGEPEEGTDVLPVVVNVREADFLQLRLGAGVGVQDDLQQVRGLLGLAHLNLWGGLQKLEWSSELAYRFIPSILEPATSGVAGASQVSLDQPDFVAKRVDLATRVRFERQLVQAFSSSRIGGRIATPIRLRRWLVFTPSYNVEWYFDVSGRAELPLRSGQRAPQLLGCGSPCVLSYLEQVIAADRRDSPFEPTYGWYAALGLQEGGGPLQGAFDWVRIAPEVRGYVPVLRDLVLAGRLQLGYLQPLARRSCAGPLSGPYANCSPILVRFFGGGASSFRGLGADQLGPLLQVEREDGVELVPLGGNSSLLASGELRWRVAEEWTAVAFLDVGSVAATPTGAFDPANAVVAVGAGARYRTPVGPARVDVGFRPFTSGRSAVTATGETVTVPQNFLDRFALFISLGEAF